MSQDKAIALFFNVLCNFGSSGGMSWIFHFRLQDAVVDDLGHVGVLMTFRQRRVTVP